ncbi:MAG: hypothetical protein AAGA18_04345 [Verrucomicrobiota bacterium]
MQWFSLLQSFEEIVFRITALLVFGPKTLFYTIFKPKYIYHYTSAELNKPQNQRFESQLSPITFLLLFGTLSTGFGIDLASQIKKDLAGLSYLFSTAGSMTSPEAVGLPWWDEQPLDVKALMSLIINLVGALSFSIIPVWYKTGSVSKNNLRRTFEYQGYIMGTFYFLVMIWFALLILTSEMNLSTTFNAVTALFLLIWFTFTQFFFLRNELAEHWRKSIGSFAISSILFCILSWITLWLFSFRLSTQVLIENIDYLDNF